MSRLTTRVDDLERRTGGDDDKPWVSLHDRGDGTFGRGAAPWGADAAEVLTRPDVEALKETHNVMIIRWGGQGDDGDVDDDVIRLRWADRASS